jgi:PAS domain S-box-containing protein
LGAVGLASLTFACFRLGLTITTTALAYVTLLAAVSLLGSFSASVILSIAAAACLNFFFTPPLFDFRVDTQEDLVAITALLATSLIVTALTTKIRRSAEAAQASERGWREVFEHNPVMYFMIDPAGTVLSVNTTGAAQLGYAVDELVGQSVLKVFIEEDREFVQRNVGVCLDTRGRSHGWEVRKVRKDGSLLWVRENAKAVWRPGNQTIILVACEDITEPRRAEEKLHQARAELAQVSRVTTLGELTAAIAHEVSQPLTGIVSSGNACLRWLANDALNLDAARHAVERMIRDSSRAAEVVSRIRALVKKSPPRYDWLDINQLRMRCS